MDKRVDSSLKVLLGRGARATASHSVRGMFGDSLLDVLPDAILETDSKGLIVAANASATSLSGWTREELLGQPIAPLMDGADVSWLENMILAYLPQGKGHSPVRSRRVFVKRKNGLPFAAELTVLEMDLGEGFGFAAILHDLTQIHEAEKALRESQERHALALAGTNEGIWDWDLTSNKVYYSERVQSLFGLEKEMGSPEDWLPFLHEEDRPRYLAAMKAHLKGETPFFNIDYR
ncbi:MAG: PAS domain S-box protein, partial [Rhodospirillales bacterium]